MFTCVKRASFKNVMNIQGSLFDEDNLKGGRGGGAGGGGGGR